MPEEPIRTFKAYKRDIEQMTRMYGAPQWRAFRLALAKATCQHPEGKRTYVTGLVPIIDESFREGSGGKRIPGFYCAACESYIFPSAGISVDASVVNEH